MQMRLFVIFASVKYGYHFYISASASFFTICIRVVIIQYSQIDNESILNAFKNKFDLVLVF
jgi:hypothetical protein